MSLEVVCVVCCGRDVKVAEEGNSDVAGGRDVQVAEESDSPVRPPPPVYPSRCWSWRCV